MPRKIPTFARIPARTGDDDAGRLSIEDFLHLWIGWQEAFQDQQHLMQLGRVGPEKAEQMPKKEQPGGEGEEELIRHLGSQSRGRIRGCLINQTPANSPDEPEVFHLRQSLLCQQQISIKLSGNFRRSTLPNQS